MMKKCLAVGIILLFVGTSIIPSGTSEQSFDKNVITVDDEPGDADYSSIKEALNHSSHGDTIEVYSGTYQENAIHLAAQGLNLQGVPHERGSGNDTGKPVVISSAYTNIFEVPGDSITITGFIIIDTVWPTVTTSIHIWGDNCVFSYNNLIGGYNTVEVGGPYHYPIHTRIIGNTIDGNTSTGISYGGTSGNISENIFHGCHCAIYVSDQGPSNIISHNTIENCDTGINFFNSSDSIISYNFISDTRTGIELRAPGGKNISIMRNQFEGCGMGIYMNLLQSLVEVHQNNFIDNSVDIRIVQYLQLKDNFLFHRIIDENYYDSWHGSGPKRIWGITVIFVIPIWMMEFFAIIPILMPRIYRDWHPVQEPYEI